LKFRNTLLSENAYWGRCAVPRLYDIVIKEKTTWHFKGTVSQEEYFL
jgi:hypothetical protein